MKIIPSLKRLLRRSVFTAAALVACAFLNVADAEAADLEPFDFVALGDMPYRPEDYAKVDRLIDTINASRPAFTLHVGDIISGRTLCSDENLERAAQQLARIEGPLIYTPGDNEWTDCHRLLGGRFDPLDRLAKIRNLMFPTPGQSLGQRPMPVESQALLSPDFATYRENVRFEKNGVHFATVHVVGSNNNFDPDRAGALGEFNARNRANIAWLDRAFSLATEKQAKALVIAWQANVHPARPNARSEAGFGDMIRSVEQGARTFGRPVLVVYGDYHFFDVRRFENAIGRRIPGVTKMMVYGDQHVHAVRVRVDPNSPGVFGFTPMIVPENGRP